MNPSFLIQEDLVAQMRGAVDSFGKLTANSGIAIRLQDDRSWNAYQNYPTEIQRQIYLNFQKYLEVVSDISNESISFTDSTQSLWRIFKKANWKPVYDLFDYIGPKDVVEIYMPDQTQLYRNGNYFDYTSYSLTELLFHPWYELFYHQDGFNEKVAQVATKVFLDKTTENYLQLDGTYAGQELKSERMLKTSLKSKLMTPLRSRDTDQPEAILVVWEMSIINESHQGVKQWQGAIPLT